MYLTTRPTPTVTLEREPERVAPEPVREAPRTGRVVATAVVLLGLTSFFTDISSEMVSSVLPLYLTDKLGFTPLQFGAIDGLYQGLAAFLCLATAIAADRRRRHKALAVTGYAASATCRLGLLVAAGAWIPTVGFLYLDRVGKGIRTAPRDAMISLAAGRAALGRNFGFHRALDTAGAVAGPLVASLLLARSFGSFDPVFVVSFCFAVVGVAIITLFVRDPRRAAVQELPSPAAHPWVRDLWGRPDVRAVLAVAVPLGLLSPGDGLLFLTFQRSADLAGASFPLLFVGTAVVFLVLALPFGRLSDRIGPRRVVLVGVLLLAATFALLASGVRGTTGLVLLFGLYGGYYAATDAVLVAWMSRVVPAARRGTGLALLGTGLGLSHLVSAVAFGGLWQRFGPTVAAVVFLAGLGVVAVHLLRAIRRERVER